MGPLTCFPSEFFLDVPASRDHIHGMEKSMDPLGLRDVLSSPTSFTKGDVFLRILSPLISVGQFKVVMGWKHTCMNSIPAPSSEYLGDESPTTMSGSHEPQHPWPGVSSHGDGLLHLDQECLHWSSTIKPWGIRKFMTLSITLPL
jgi:hypothetical protein